MSTSTYHHGDLRSALLREADRQLRRDGIDALSLRRVAEAVGVSRTAPYHHFRDKQTLLSALAAEGFHELEALMDRIAVLPGPHLARDLRRFVRAYLDFALEHPARYELMFGHRLWKAAEVDESLREVAFRTFRHYAQHMQALVPGERRRGRRPLRIAQASWATLHGLCRLMIDGIYVDPPDMAAVSDEAVRMLVMSLSPDGPVAE